MQAYLNSSRGRVFKEKLIWCQEYISSHEFQISHQHRLLPLPLPCISVAVYPQVRDRLTSRLQVLGALTTLQREVEFRLIAHSLLFQDQPLLLGYMLAVWNVMDAFRPRGLWALPVAFLSLQTFLWAQILDMLWPLSTPPCSLCLYHCHCLPTPAWAFCSEFNFCQPRFLSEAAGPVRASVLFSAWSIVGLQ